ncbi:MAG: stage II sporulation protein P [Acutalibacteraceae bacterium]|jgi:stage II sporulation protein P
MRGISRILKVTTALVTAAALLVVCPGIWQDLRAVTKKAAVLSAGLRQPREAAAALSERLRAGSPAPRTTTFSTASTSTTASAPVTLLTNAPAPPRSQKGGTVVEQALPAGKIAVGHVAWQNRSGTDVDVVGQFGKTPAIRLTGTDAPQVLIVHTHTTESYMDYYSGYYNDSDVTRTKDAAHSVVAVGEEIAARLRDAGIGVIHDRTVHDSPQYTGAYDRAAQTIQKNLKAYPTIQVVLDIHRDAIMPDDTTKIKPTVTVDGRKAAQVMIIAGVVDDPDASHPHWRDNLRLALALQEGLATRYPGLARPLSAVASRYNEHLTRGSLLIEIGTDANTVAEAVYSGGLVGQTLAAVLADYKQGG